MMPKHPFDPLSLVFAVIFGGVAALAYVGPSGRIVDPRWVLPGLLVLIGVFLLVPSRRRSPQPPPAERSDELDAVD